MKQQRPAEAFAHLEIEPDTTTAIRIVEGALQDGDARFLRSYSLPLFPSSSSAQERQYNHVAAWVNTALHDKGNLDLGTVRVAVKMMKRIMAQHADGPGGEKNNAQ